MRKGIEEFTENAYFVLFYGRGHFFRVLQSYVLVNKENSAKQTQKNVHAKHTRCFSLLTH